METLVLLDDLIEVPWRLWFHFFTSVMEINKICDDVKMEIKDRKLNNNGQ